MSMAKTKVVRLPNKKPGETDDDYRLRYNAYMRVYMRKKRNAPYLDVLEDEAEKRHISPTELKRRLLERIADENLFASILD